MSKLRRSHEDNYPYFVTATTAHRQPVFQDRGNAELMREVLYQTRARYSFSLLSFVIMPDHLHAVMRFIKGTSARALNERHCRVGALWQPRFYDRAIRDEAALRAALLYVEQNLVKAAIVASAAEYEFSSAFMGCDTDLEAYLGGPA